MTWMDGGPAHAVNAWRDGWYVVPWQVTFRDVDSFGHVNNAVYFTYFEWARTQLWFAITGGSEPRDIGFIVARAECDFKQQIEMEPIEVLVRIDVMRTTSVDFVYEIRKTGKGAEKDGQDRKLEAGPDPRGPSMLAATGRVVVVLFDWDTQSKIAVSDELRRKVRMFQQEE
jgi:YbgC/YbaW family acyl-CoA thioester hydrolase